VIYLVMFILLHNTALIIRHDEGYAMKHGMKVRMNEESRERAEDLVGRGPLLMAAPGRGLPGHNGC
jgi:hypothetical protein